MMRFFISLIALLIGTLGLAGQSAMARDTKAGVFDYYVLSLSWSPSFCAGKTSNRNKDQCGPGRNYAFVVHGLWPQYNRGWPSNCRTDERWVDKRQINQMMDIMPSKGLIIHEWKKHGTCSGLSQKAYFKLLRDSFTKIKIPARYISPTATITISPAQMLRDFAATNRGLTPSQMSLQCGNRRDQAQLRELRICFSKTGELTACGHNENRRCRARQLVLPPVR